MCDRERKRKSSYQRIYEACICTYTHMQCVCVCVCQCVDATPGGRGRPSGDVARRRKLPAAARVHRPPLARSSLAPAPIRLATLRPLLSAPRSGGGSARERASERAFQATPPRGSALLVIVLMNWNRSREVRISPRVWDERGTRLFRCTEDQWCGEGGGGRVISRCALVKDFNRLCRMV